MSFEELYDNHKIMVFNLALNYAQNIEDAEEITQDVFVNVYNAFKDFKGQSSPSTWIYRITVNKSLDFLKAKQRKKRFAYVTSLFFKDGVTIKHDPIEYAHPGIVLENKENLYELLSHIEQLPFNQKTAIICRKFKTCHKQKLRKL